MRHELITVKRYDSVGRLLMTSYEKIPSQHPDLMPKEREMRFEKIFQQMAAEKRPLERVGSKDSEAYRRYSEYLSKHNITL
jgi:hypothetical protein